MAAVEEPFSSEFADAARAEADRLKIEAQQLRGSAVARLRSAEMLTAQALELEQRARDLDEMLGRAPQMRLDLPDKALRGQDLREAAVRVIATRHAIGEPIHYRHWFELLLRDGHRVAGKDPLATFLTQITRSPLVERAGDESGVYRVDPAAGAERALREQTAAEAKFRHADESYRSALESARAAGAHPDLPEISKLQERLREARRRVTAAERAVGEVARAEALLLMSHGG